MKVLTEAAAIRAAQDKLKQTLRNADLFENTAIGFPGDNMPDRTVHWHNQAKFWYAYERVKAKPARKATKNKPARRAKPPHFWNGFGIQHPHQGKGSKSLTVEINPATSGVDRQLGGVFVSDHKGRVFLGHSGKIGGGAPGVGKSAFEKWYKRGRWVKVDWSGKVAEVVKIAFLDDPHFTAKIGAFVHDVAKFKLLKKRQRDNAKAKQKSNRGQKAAKKKADKKQVRPESDEVKIKKRFNVGPSSRKGFLLHIYIKPNNHHHTVVTALRRALAAYRTATPKRTDCVIHKGNTATHIFEIKTSSDTTAVFTAVGQLYCYAAELKANEDAKRIAVLPFPDSASRRLKIEKSLPEMKVGIVWYERVGKRVIFDGLDKYVHLRNG